VISGFSIYTDATTAAPRGSSVASDSGAGGGGSSAASAPPSTVGARGAQRRGHKKIRKGSASRKIKQGSPEEERALSEHLANLGPPEHALVEAGQITELLCVLGHVDDAQRLQFEVGAWQAEHAAAAGQLAAMAAEEQAVNSSDMLQQQQLQQQQQPQPQQLQKVSWKWDVLRS
jgi:hypothetical protein